MDMLASPLLTEDEIFVGTWIAPHLRNLFRKQTRIPTNLLSKQKPSGAKVSWLCASNANILSLPRDAENCIE